MAKLHVEVVTGERIVFQMDDADMAVVPGVDGMLGILPGHAQLISLLTNGELRVKKGGAEESIVVFGGFVEVSHDRVTILADTAERASDIDIERAEAARANAEDTKRNRSDVVSIAEADAALRRAAVRLRIGQRRRGRTGINPNP